MATGTRTLHLAFLLDNTVADVTDIDVVMAFRFFLGRGPENDAAIANHKGLIFGTMLQKVIQSDEFINSVYENVTPGAKLSRPDGSQSPSGHQIDWIISKLILDERQKGQIRQIRSWGEFFAKFFIFDQAFKAGLSVGLSETLVSMNQARPESGDDDDKDVNSSYYDEIELRLGNIERLLLHLRSMI